MAHAAQQLVRQARIFATLLKDPHKPNCCALCLISFAEKLKDDKAAVTALRTDCHEFWEACLTVLAVHRKEEVVATDLPRSSFYLTVECKRESQHTGGPAHGSNYAPFHLFVDAVYRCLIAGLTGGDRSMIGRVLQMNKGFNNKRGLWPASSEDLFPVDAATTIESHAMWCCRFVAPSTYTGLAAFLAVTRPLASPHIIDGHPGGRLVWAIVQMLRVDLERIVEPADYRGTAPCQMMDQWTRPDWMRPGPQNESVSAACILLAVISDGPDAQADDMVRFTLHDEPVLFPAVQVALNHVARGSAAHTTLCKYALSLHSRLLGRSTQPDAGLLPQDVLAFRDAQPDTSSPVGVLHMYVLRRAALRGCTAQKCGKVMHASDSGKAFPLCAKCKTVRYCGRECQRRDWSDPTIANHKKICPLLCRISAAAGNVDVAKLSLEEFKTAFREAAFDTPDEYTLFSWTTHSAVLPLMLSHRMLALLQHVLDIAQEDGTIPGCVANMKVPDIGTEGQLEERIRGVARTR